MNFIYPYFLDLYDIYQHCLFKTLIPKKQQILKVFWLEKELFSSLTLKYEAKTMVKDKKVKLNKAQKK